MNGETENRNYTAERILGAGIGILAFGAVAVVSAPVAIPAIGIGLGAVGVSALTGTAIGFGLVGVSAVAGGVVGGFSAPDIYEGIKVFFDDNKRKSEEKDTLGGNASVHSEEERKSFIKQDFTTAESTKQFLELVDHYRQSAIKEVLDGGDVFDDKAKRINKIFDATAFTYDELNNKETFKSVKSRMQVSIISDVENFSFKVVKHFPPEQDSFILKELFKRIFYNRKFITGILDDQVYTKETKHEALKDAYLQHEISGNNKQYPKTFDAQIIYMNEILSRDVDNKIKKDVDGYLSGLKTDLNIFYFPNLGVNMAYHEDCNKREKIDADFAKVTNQKQFFELVDAYREFAINEVFKGAKNFDQKKKKIEDIFDKTTFNYDRNNPSEIILKQSGSNTPASLNELKDSLKQKITKDLEFPVDLSKSPKKISLTEDELLQRIIYNKLLISAILNLSENEDQKQRALNWTLYYIAIYQDGGDLEKFIAKKNFLQEKFQVPKAIEQAANTDAGSFFSMANDFSLPSQNQPASTITFRVVPTPKNSLPISKTKSPSLVGGGVA